jgi:hypothetical protein
MMLNSEDSQLAANAIAYSADMAASAWQEAAYLHRTYWAVLRPKLFIEGNQWCALYGENIQDGVAGFGDSAAHALEDFDSQMIKRLAAQQEKGK